MSCNNDKEATQIFAIRNILVSECMKKLTPELIEKIIVAISDEIKSGSCSWAFKQKDKNDNSF